MTPQVHDYSVSGTKKDTLFMILNQAFESD